MKNNFELGIPLLLQLRKFMSQRGAENEFFSKTHQGRHHFGINFERPWAI
jgi:hypothetical protein